MTTGNLFEQLPISLPAELFTTLLEAPQLRIERILSQGQVTPDGEWYDQQQHEWVILLQGAARLRFEDRQLNLKPGDYVHIPAHTKHRVEWTPSDQLTIWLAIHYGKFE